MSGRLAAMLCLSCASAINLCGCPATSAVQDHPQAAPTCAGAASPPANELSRALADLAAQSPETRLDAIRRLRQCEAEVSWLLMKVAAGDPDASVRAAAAEAVVRMAQDFRHEVSQRYVEILVETTLPHYHLKNVPFNDAITELSGEYSSTGHLLTHQHYGFSLDSRVTVSCNSKLTLAEAWCRVLVATGRRWQLVLGDRLYIHSLLDSSD